jgi:hypothetical protein
MTEFNVGDTVRVEMPRGYNKRGVLGISVMYTTWPEARFEGATGRVAEINPRAGFGVHQYLVDFRGQDNSRLGIPWQAQWFREEWLALVERPPAETEVVAGASDATGHGVASRQANQPPSGGDVAVSERSATTEPTTATADAGGATGEPVEVVAAPAAARAERAVAATDNLQPVATPEGGTPDSDGESEAPAEGGRVEERRRP